MVPVMTYEPRMSAEEAERLRRWHERAYAESRVEGDSGQTFEYLGLILDVPADVMPNLEGADPKVTTDAGRLALWADFKSAIG